MSTKVTVRGVKATLSTLREFDDDLYWRTVNKMKSAAKPLAAAIDGNFPQSAPLSGFDHNGRTGWRRPKVTEIKVGGKRNKRTGEWPLVRIVIRDAARAIFDMAAAGNLNTALSRYGSASRAAWRTSAAIRSTVTDDVLKVVKEQTKRTNIKLTRYP